MQDFILDITEKSYANNLTITPLQRSLPFCAVSCGKFYAGEKYFTKRDCLNNYLLLVTTYGTGKIICKGQTCLLKPGNAVIIDCNIPHEYQTATHDVWHFYYLHFNALSFAGYGEFFLNTLTAIPLSSFHRICDLIEKLYHLSFCYDTKTSIIISNIISDILTEMVCSCSDADKTNMQSVRKDIQALKEYISEHFTNELHIADFMEQIHLSRHYLIHIFKKQIGISPYQFMHMCRIHHAQSLLIHTDQSISQIAENSGYNSTTVFIRHFKAFQQMTPKEYRMHFRDIP